MLLKSVKLSTGPRRLSGRPRTKVRNQMLRTMPETVSPLRMLRPMVLKQKAPIALKLSI